MFRYILFTVVVGLSILLPSTQADIIWSGSKDVQLPYNLLISRPEDSINDVYELDLNEDGVGDFTFNYYSGVRVTPSANNALAQTGGILGAGASVEGSSSMLPWATEETDCITYLYTDAYGSAFSGAWLFASEDSMGLSFEVDGETHYGWARITTVGETMILNDWAYESIAGEGIIVGAVPEPATVLLFGLGGLGAWLLRRNKISTANQSSDPT